MGRVRRGAVTVVLAVVAAFAGAGPASAWYGPFVFTSPSSAKPGSEVSAQGYYWAKTDPVQARLDAIDGKVLATFTPRSGSKGMEFQGPVPVPADTRAGVHVLVFTQVDAAGKIVQMPPRALLIVTDATGAVPVVGAAVGTDPAARPTSLARTGSDRLDVGELLLIAVGAAGVAILVAGIAAVAAGGPVRRRSAGIAR